MCIIHECINLRTQKANDPRALGTLTIQQDVRQIYICHDTVRYAKVCACDCLRFTVQCYSTLCTTKPSPFLNSRALHCGEVRDELGKRKWRNEKSIKPYTLRIKHCKLQFFFKIKALQRTSQQRATRATRATYLLHISSLAGSRVTASKSLTFWMNDHSANARNQARRQDVLAASYLTY